MVESLSRQVEESLDEWVARFGGCPCQCHCSTPRPSSLFEKERDPSKALSAVSDQDNVRSCATRLEILQVCCDHQSLISSLDWDISGECLITCSMDNSVGLLNITRGTSRHLFSRKYGAQCGRFVRDSQTHCIVASRTYTGRTSTCGSILASLGRIPWSSVREYMIHPAYSPHAHSVLSSDESVTSVSPSHATTTSHALRYWDLQENRFVQTYTLPAPVVPDESLSVSRPPSNLVMASCQDATVRIFSFDREKPLAFIECHTTAPLSTLHSSGSVGAIQILPFVIQLFDFRAGWQHSDYASIDLEKAIPVNRLLPLEKVGTIQNYADRFRVTNLLISTVTSSLYVTLTDIHTFQAHILEFDLTVGALKRVYQDQINDFVPTDVEKWKLNLDASPGLPIHFIPSLSADGQFLSCGSPHRYINVWSTHQDTPSLKRSYCGTRLAKFVSWNPVDVVLASAFDHVSFWGMNGFDTDQGAF